jgi:signal transduction histidine kinase
VSTRIDASASRPGRIGGGIAACLLMGGLAFAVNPLLETFARTASPELIHATRLSLESSALLLSVAAILPLLRRTDVPATPLIPFGLTLNAGQSLLFLVALPWDWTWWAAHAIGGAAMGVLAWAVVVVERDEMRAREARRWQEIAEMRADFINAAGHQLNTPLTPVLLTLPSLKARTSEDPALHRQVMLLDRNLKRLSETVAELVDATLVADDVKTKRQAMDLQEALQAACARVSRERDVECAMKTGDPVFVSAHPRVLKYVLLAVLRAPGAPAIPAIGIAQGHAVVELPRRPDEGIDNELRLHLARSLAERDGLTLDLEDPGFIRLYVPLLVRPPTSAMANRHVGNK